KKEHRRGHNGAAAVVAIIIVAALLIPTGKVLAQAKADTGTVLLKSELSRYVDQTNGLTADEAVAYALAHNGELEAARREIDAAKAMVKQARLRANPKLDNEGTRQIPSGKDDSNMAGPTVAR